MIKFKWETEFKKTEIGEIPGEWDIVELGKLADIKTGKTNVQDAVESGEYPLFDRSYEFKKSNKYLFDTEAVIVLGEGKDFLPRYYIGKFDLHQRTYAIFNFQQNLKGKYLYFTMFILRYYLREWAVGSTVLSLRLLLFKQLPILLPPSPEQSRIATVLSWFDDLIENKKRQNEILEKTAMAIFKSWFVDFELFKDEEFVYSEELGKEIPKGWEIKAIGEVVDILYGRGLPESKRKNGSFPVVGSSGIVGYHAQFLATPPSIVIGRKGNAGSVYLMLEPFYPIDTVFYTGKTTPAITFYIYHHLKLTPLAEIGMTDTAVPGININNLKAVKIPIPLQPILQHFHSLVEPLFQKIIFNQRQIMVLRKIRDALLPKLVFGRLRVEEV